MSFDKNKENMTALMLWLTVIEEWKVNYLVNNKNMQVTWLGSERSTIIEIEYNMSFSFFKTC